MARAVVILILCAVHGRVAAQDDAGAGEAEPSVDELIAEGVALREQQQDAEALAVFQRAHALSNEPRALAQVAFAEQALGRWRDAEAHLVEALAAAEDPWIAERADALRAELSRIQSHLGDLEVLCEVEGARVSIDGEDAGTLPWSEPARVPVGELLVEVEAEGFVPVRRTVRITTGALVRETIRLSPVEPDEPAAPDDPEEVTPPPHSSPPDLSRVDDDGTWTTLGVAALVAGGVALGAGVGFSIWREDRARQFNSDDCLGDRPRGEICGDAYDDAGTAQAAAAVAYAFGGVFVIGGVFALVLAGDAGQTEERTAVRCGPGPGLVGIGCGGRF